MRERIIGMKKVLILFLAVITIFSAIPLSVGASLGTLDNGLVYSITNGEAAILDYTGEPVELTVPEAVDDCPVTSIGYKAFYECTSLESITLPSCVKIIDEYAFYNCSSLESITIPDGVTSIGNYAFSNCTSLLDITISKSVTSIGTDTFLCCSALTSITVEEGNSVYHSAKNCLVETAAKTVVLGCKNSEIPADGSVTSIGGYAFYCCSGLESIIIPEGVTRIASHAFEECSDLKTVVLPESIIYIGEYSDNNTDDVIFWAFGQCPRIKFVYYNGSSQMWDDIIMNDESCLTSANIVFAKQNMDDYVNREDLFEYKISNGKVTVTGYNGRGTTLNIPAAIKGYPVTAIGTTNSFGDSSFPLNITHVTLPQGVTSINAYTFYNSKSLESITVPESLTSIGDSAFYGCSELKTVNYLGSPQMWDDIAMGRMYDWLTSANVVFAKENTDGYTTNNLTYIIADGMVSVTGYKGRAENVVIPETIEGFPVVSIATDAFKGLTSITSMVVPYGVVSISNRAFYNCSNLRSITLPGSLMMIWEEAFFGCRKLETVCYVGSELQFWDMFFWSNLEDACLTDVNIVCTKKDFNGFVYDISGNEATVCRYIGYSKDAVIPAFIEGCPVTKIDQGTFSGMISITSVAIPGSVTEIGEKVFSDCRSLSTVYYNGSFEKWKEIVIGEGNEALDHVAVIFPCDVNCDGVVNAEDSLLLCKLVVGDVSLKEAAEKLYISDLNGDGKVNGKDSYILKKKLSG